MSKCDFWSCSEPGHRVKLPDASIGSYCDTHEARVLENYALAAKHTGPHPWVRSS